MGHSECSPGDLPRQLAIEKQLLAEEKFLVSAMKRVIEEQHSLQVERLQMMSQLHELQRRANPPPVPKQPQPHSYSQPLPPQPLATVPPPAATAPASHQSSLASEFDLPIMDDEDLINDMNLNLTVPDHPFYEPVSHDHDDDEFEIEMGMLMNMTTDKD